MCLQGLPEDKVANAKAAAQAETVPEHNEEGKAYTKKEKAALQRAAARELEATAANEALRMEPEARRACLTALTLYSCVL